MRGNDRFLFTRGAANTVLPFHLYDEETKAHAAAEIVYLMVKQKHAPAPFDWAECVITEKSVGGESFFVKGYFVFDEAKSNLPPGEYRLRFKVFYSDFSKDFFPLSEDDAIGKLEVKEVF